MPLNVCTLHLTAFGDLRARPAPQPAVLCRLRTGTEGALERVDTFWVCILAVFYFLTSL